MLRIFEIFGLGKIGSNGHPIHPSTVHWPLAFLSLAYLLDVGQALFDRGKLDIPMLEYKSHRNELSHMAFYSHILGVLTAMPAVATGLTELWAMISSNGLWQKEQRKSDGTIVSQGLIPKVKIALIHAALNDVVLANSAYSIWTRLFVTDFRPKDVNAVLYSTMLLGGIMLSGYYGGSLVYDYGVGVQRMGEAAQIKEDNEKSETVDEDGMTVTFQKTK